MHTNSSKVNCKQIQRRFDVDAEIHDVVQCTLPQRAVAQVPASLASVVKKLPYLNAILDAKKLDGEWTQHVFEENLNPDLHIGRNIGWLSEMLR